MDKRIIHTVFESKAQQFPGNIAVEDVDMQLTYQELDQQANGLASCLRELGVGRDRVVMTLMGADVKLIVSLLGILKAGGIYLPTDVNFPARLMAQVFEESNPGVIITTEDLLPETRALVAKHQASVSTLLVLKADLSFYPIRLKESSLTLQPDVQPEDGCYIIYTSGSTGKAKAILGNHKGLSHFIHWEMGEFGLDEHTVVSQLSQFTFDASLRDIFVPLASGGKLCLPQAGLRNNIPMLIDWLQEKKVSLVHCVPAIFKLITRYLETTERNVKQALLPDLRFILMAGEPLYARDITSWREIMGEQVELVNLYGTSETTMAKTFHRIGTVPADPGTALHVGKAISNTAIAVFNGNKLCSPGEIGEIYIKTPFRTKGYYNNEVLTNTVFVQNPLVTDRADIMHKTGDMGRYFADGTLEVHGRLDDQVKVNGIRVELGEVKQAVLSAPAVADAAVIVLKNAQEENELVCYYVSAEATETSLREHLAHELSASIIPAHFIRLDELPLTINGKVDKKALPRPVITIAAGTEDDLIETDPVVLSMQRIWMEVLGLPQVSRNTSFFQAGGTSLKAIMVISRLYKTYHVQLKIKDIFEHPTLISLCDFVQHLQQKAFESIGLVPRNDNYETTYAQKGIWLHLQYGRGLSAYNMTGAYDFKGNFNLDAFKKTLYLLVDRYEILRTTFVMDKGELRQRVHDFETALVKLQLEDYSDHPSPGIAAAEAASAGSLKVFDPLKEPLIRFHLIRQQETHHTLVISQHHLIADGWSISILLREFLEVFTAFCRDEDPQLSALNIQYKDYAAWHNRYINSTSSNLHKAFWKEQLDGDLQPLNLSGNTQRGIGKTYEGNLYSFDLPSDLSLSVFNMGKTKEKSTFAILLTLTNILLYGYTGHEDIILGAPFAGRTHPDLENQLGLFVSIIMLRNHLRADQDFSTLLNEVARNATAAYEHGIYPFEKILEELELTNGQGLQFLNVFVQMQETHEDALTAHQKGIQDLSVTALDFKHLTSKFDLTFNFVASTETGRISVVIEYNTAMFTENKMIKLQEDFVRLLSLVAANENISLTELILHLPAEQNVEITEISGKISEGISTDY